MTGRLRQFGFTLLELMVVAAIMVMLAGATGGMYLGTYQRQKVEKAARDLLLAARYGRMLAVERCAPCTLYLDKTAGRFWLTLPQNQDPENTSAAEPTFTDKSIGNNSFDSIANEEIVRDMYCRPVELEDDIKIQDIVIISGDNDIQDEVSQSSDALSISGPARIIFTPYGTADTAVVTISDGGRHTFYITIAAGTGKARLSTSKDDLDWAQPVDLDRQQ